MCIMNMQSRYTTGQDTSVIPRYKSHITGHHRLILGTDDDDTMSHSWAGTLDTECRYFEHCCVCAGAGVDSVDSVDSAVVRGPGD